MTAIRAAAFGRFRFPSILGLRHRLLALLRALRFNRAPGKALTGAHGPVRRVQNAGGERREVLLMPRVLVRHRETGRYAAVIGRTDEWRDGRPVALRVQPLRGDLTPSRQAPFWTRTERWETTGRIVRVPVLSRTLPG